MFIFVFLFTLNMFSINGQLSKLLSYTYTLGSFTEGVMGCIITLVYNITR